jgi:hypothetical protein
MQQPCGCSIRKLRDRISDAKPNCSPSAVTISREFVRVLGAFQHRLVTVASKHEVGYAPNVDLRDHEAARSLLPNAARFRGVRDQETRHALAEQAEQSDTRRAVSIHHFLVASAEELTVASAPPVVVSTEPRAGQTDVAPGTNEIRVTFSRPMRDGGWSWVKLSDTSFPETTETRAFSTISAPACCPCPLEPGKTYAMWLNQPPYKNFQGQDGHKAVPYLLMFETRH